MEKKEDLNFWIKIESANLYMAEHFSPTIYFPSLTYRIPLNPGRKEPLPL
jgi:hypothetical protein